MQFGSDELSGTDFSLCSYTTKYLREVGVDRKVQNVLDETRNESTQTKVCATRQVW